ncbi:MAG: small ribosomal subunit Rsm22 family protein [Puniceicoccales bacterium]|jgi:SAM-dependent methyltransferase|nr:small ribosomal subunit Rsm22 family protein [Puniceicoccales bacterium]
MNPVALEKFWITKARTSTGAANDDIALDKIRPAVQQLSDLFTVKRPDGTFPDYAFDPALLAAYGLFFFPQSYVRARIALDQPMRFRGWRPLPDNDGIVRVLDLGSGTGPCGLAAASALREIAPEISIALTALDHAPAALATLRQIARETFPEKLTIETEAVDLRHATHALNKLPRQHLIIAGFATNELFSDHKTLRDWISTLRIRLTDDGLLIILEPALRETATRLQHAADALVSTPSFFRWAPELSDAPCPILAEQKYWNHEVRRWSPPQSLEYLNRHLFRDISVLKFAYTALGIAKPSPLPENPTPFRLVSPLEPLKGRFVFTAVTSGGKKITVDIPTRGLSKSEIKSLASQWQRGDVAASSTLQPLGQENTFRIPIIEEMIPLYRWKDARIANLIKS